MAAAGPARAVLSALRTLALAVAVPLAFLAVLHLWPVASLVRAEAVSEALELEIDLERETFWWIVPRALLVLGADGARESLPVPPGEPAGTVRLGLAGTLEARIETLDAATLLVELGPPERCAAPPAAGGAGCRPAVARVGERALELADGVLVAELVAGPAAPPLAFAGRARLGRLAGDARTAPPRLLREGRVTLMARDLLGSVVFEAGTRALLPGDRVRFLAAPRAGRVEAEGDGILRLAEGGTVALVFHAAADAVQVARADLEPVLFRASALGRLGHDPLLQSLAALFLTVWGGTVRLLVERLWSPPAGARPEPGGSPGGLPGGPGANKDGPPPTGSPTMQPFTTLRGTAAPFPAINVDTDKIIPARHLKTIERTGLGVALFESLRYDDQGRERPDFVLNQPKYRKASILIAGENFGCGSSREHAPWALMDYGIRCVIAPSFADIFHSNAFKNGMLLITLPKEEVELLMKEAESAADPTFEVDLEAQEIRRPTGNAPIRFDIDPFRKHCLVNGLDDIGLTMERVDRIAAFEAGRRRQFPWLDPAAARAG